MTGKKLIAVTRITNTDAARHQKLNRLSRNDIAIAIDRAVDNTTYHDIDDVVRIADTIAWRAVADVIGNALEEASRVEVIS